MTELICIVCPKGCHLKVDEENYYKVSGNACSRGEEYGKIELLNPTRVITSTVFVKNGTHRLCSLKTDSPIKKSLVKKATKLLDSVEIEAPIKIGQVVLENILDTGVNFVATKNIPKSNY